MRSPTPSFRRLLAAVLALAGAGRAGAQLAATSPFLPAPNSAAAAPAADTTVKYMGFIETPEGILYRVVDPTRKAAAFLKLNQRDEALGVTLKQHDAAANTVVVDYQGRTLTLAEPKAKIVSTGAPMQMMSAPPPQMTNVATPVTQSVVLNPTPADEQRRLEAVASEVARRRALREQAQTQINPGVAPQATVPPPQPIRAGQPGPNLGGRGERPVRPQ